MSNSKKIKSRLIFVLRDQDGVIDTCDIILLKKLRQVSESLKVILCGEFCQKDVWEDVQAFCDEVVVRSAEDSDFFVIRDEICSHACDSYDELLFVNNSMFGPFYSLNEIVNHIREKEFDFWGMTKVGERVTDQWEIIPKHLQLYFFAVEKKMLHSREIHKFFENESNNSCFECKFTSYFENLGFQWGTFIDVPKYDSNSVTKNIDAIYEVCFELVTEHNFPFLKKDYFTYKDLSNTYAYDLRHLVDYITEKNLYDSDMIWDCVLRKYNITQIKDSMSLNYILDVSNDEVSGVSIDDCQETAIIMHLAYEESIDGVYKYVREIPKEIRKFFVVINEGLAQYLEKSLSSWQCENYEVRVMFPNRGRDMNSLFVVCRDVWEKYTYLCFTHDKRTSGDTGAYTVGKEFMNILWENTLKSSGYIKRILARLKYEKRLGYLAVPVPYHSFYCRTSARTWTNSYEVTKELAEKMQIEVDISKEFLPFGLGTAFWCKTKALKNITDYHLKTDDFCEEPMPRDGTISHALERIMIFAAQNVGYYSGIVENTEYAQNELNNKNFMMTKLIDQLLVQPQYCSSTNFPRFVRYANDSSFFDFLQKRKKIYIWGAGKTGKDTAGELKKLGYSIQGYVCSEGIAKPQNSENSVFYLSELDLEDEELGIVLAVHKKFYKDLQETLEEMGDMVYCL